MRILNIMSVQLSSFILWNLLIKRYRTEPAPVGGEGGTDSGGGAGGSEGGAEGGDDGKGAKGFAKDIISPPSDAGLGIKVMHYALIVLVILIVVAIILGIIKIVKGRKK